MRPALVMGTLTAAMGGLLFGFDTAVISGVTHSITVVYHLSPLMLGFTVSSALLGTILGTLLARMPADRLGRKTTLFLLAALYLISAVGCALAWNWSAVVAFRIIGGVGIGGSSVLGPMYIAEISPPQWRGRLGSFFQLNVCAGVLLAYLSNYLVGLASLGDAEWRWKLGVGVVPALLFGLLVITIRESPRWLMSVGRKKEAVDVFCTLSPGETVQLLDQLHSVQTSLKDSDRLFSRNHALPIFLAISIGFFNQMSGVNAILYYLNDIFAWAGFDRFSASRQAVAVGASNFLVTMLAMACIDKIGRRKLLLIGAVGTAICLGGIAGIFISGTRQNLLVWLLVGFIGFFTFSQGAVIWVYLSEVFPTRVRAAGASLGSLTHWTMNALISGLFPVVAANAPGMPFVCFSAMMVFQFVVVLALYPETKGLTLEDIQSKIAPTVQ